MRTFTVAEARSLLGELLEDVDRLVVLRADLTAALHAQRAGDPSVPLADVKALEARVAEILDGIGSHGIQVKGYAPLLLDFPAELDGRDVLLCWLEGERELAWYHDAAHGFAGRRPLEG